MATNKAPVLDLRKKKYGDVMTMEELHQMKLGNFIDFTMETWTIQQQEEYLHSMAKTFKFLFVDAVPGLHPTLLAKYLASGFLVDVKKYVHNYRAFHFGLFQNVVSCPHTPSMATCKLYEKNVKFISFLP